MLDHDIIETIRALDETPSPSPRHLARTFGKNGLPALPAQPDPAALIEAEAIGASRLMTALFGAMALPPAAPTPETPLHRALIEAMAKSTTWKGDLQ